MFQYFSHFRWSPWLGIALFFSLSVSADEIEIRGAMKRPLAHSSASLLSVPSLGSPDSVKTRMGFVENWLTANELCREAQVVEFRVNPGILSILPKVDYCELPKKKVPQSVAMILNQLKMIHAQYAKVTGMDPIELFGFGVQIRLKASPIGPLHSATDNVVNVSVFKDFRPQNFPAKIYVHELTHWLLLNGKLGEAAQLIEPSFLFYEGFPDLVASYVMESTEMGFYDPTVRPALTFPRDVSPLKSMNRSFRFFANSAFEDEILDICKHFPKHGMSFNESSLCLYFREKREETVRTGGLYNRTSQKAPTSRELDQPFRPEFCVLKNRDGSGTLDNCVVDAFSPVFVSFMRSIAPALGPRPIATLLKAINDATEFSGTLKCGFGQSRKIPLEKLNTQKMATPSLVKVFQTLALGLDDDGKALYGKNWNEHGLDSWLEMEVLDREFATKDFIYQRLLEANSEFSILNRCNQVDLSDRDPDCKMTCTYEKGRDPA